MSKTIDIGKDFARYPFGRYRADGPYSGEVFREDYLLPELRRNDEQITILLDEARGMGSSFLEEAFAGLLRENFDISELRHRLKIVSKDQTRVSQIWDYIEDEFARPTTRKRA